MILFYSQIHKKVFQFFIFEEKILGVTWWKSYSTFSFARDGVRTHASLIAGLKSAALNHSATRAFTR
jgi:hypothetical protein